MKAFLTRLNRGLAGGREKDREKDPQAPKEKVPQLPPLPDWPPTTRVTSTPNSINSFKPLPELSVRPLPPIGESSSSSTESSLTTTPIAANPPLPATETKENIPATVGSTSPPAPASEGHHSTRADGSTDSTGRSSRKAANGTSSDAQKKVAFLSPPPTPGPLQDRALPGADTPTPTPTPGVAVKSTVSRFHAAHGKETRGSTSTAASSRTDVASTLKSNKPGSTRTATSPYSVKGYEASLHQSLRSTTPFSQMSNTSSRILAAQSWSEGAEDDLVSNLGQRERTRQEVLWEIVASEERYVNELLKMKETFIEPLLHPHIVSPVSSPTPMDFYDDLLRADTPRESLEHLPIAARFLGSPDRSDSPAPINETSPRKEDNHPNIDGESMNSAEEDEAEDRMGAAFHSSRQKTVTMSLAAKHNHPRSPYGTTAARSGKSKVGTSVPFPSRSHQSLPPPPRANLMTSSTQSLGRQSFVADSQREYEHSPPSMRTTGTGASRVLRKFKKSSTGPDTIIHGAVPPAQLPEDLRKCLEVIEGGILDGHIRLSEGLRKRYEDQYPLVRSLADVFVTNSHILHGYATYVLHLERALEQVDNALSTASKKPKKQDADQWHKICQFVQKLEITASEKGETGLAISLSKPFQRLLKYPLLFQNLLYHTDPSTFEYESTLQMVAEVETIVRSIEDEKIQKEERDKTRDVFARIEGLDKVKQLMVPKPSRVLVEERPVVGVNPLTDPTKTDSRSTASPPLSSQNPKNVKGKSSFKRLSDVLQSGSSGVGGKKDLWLVVFNDVVLRCQRTGTTSLPLVSGGANSRANSLPELQGKAKYATTGRRGPITKPRNLYKFLKIETWDIGNVVQPREGVVSMEEVAKSRQQVHSGVQPRIIPMPTEEEEEAANDSDDSDRKSKMSFSYWGADKVTLQKPIVKPKAPLANGSRRAPTPTTAYARESSANAKFGTRLVQDAPHQAPRPASRRTVATPVNRKVTPHSDEGHSVRVTITRDRPTWDSSTRAPAATPQLNPNKRTRNVSQTSAATRVTTTPNTNKALGSPAPSEDSGVGFIRNMVNQNPSLNRLIP